MAAPLRLLQIGKHFAPDTGGIETVTEAIAASLPAADVTADVLCMGLRGRTYADVDRPYAVVRAAPDAQFGNKTISLGYVAAVGRLQRDHDAALLHLPNPLGAAAALALWRKPLLLLWHADTPQRRLRRLLAPLDRAIIGKAAAVIVPTPVHATGSYAAGALVPKMVVAPYPFDRSRLARPAPVLPSRIAAFTAGRRFVLGVGRLVSYKGFRFLVEAAADLPPDLAVVIVGDGGERADLAARIAAAGVGDRVLLAGPLDDAGLSACFAAALLFCLPSVTAAEMYGIVQVEALAHGLPIVSTRIPRSGVDWVNRDEVSGLIVPPGDTAALGHAIARIAGDAALHARLSRGAGELFDEIHDLDRAARAYAAAVIKAVCHR